MAKTCEEMVEQIRKFFQDRENVSNHEAMKLWNVLTGLRGPDDVGDGRTKGATTAVIRHFVLQIDLDANRDLPVDVANRDTDACAEIRRHLDPEDAVRPHFIDHAKRAFAALGLSWDHTNVEPKPDVKVSVDGKIEPYPGWD